MAEDNRVVVIRFGHDWVSLRTFEVEGGAVGRRLERHARVAWEEKQASFWQAWRIAEALAGLGCRRFVS